MTDDPVLLMVEEEEEIIEEMNDLKWILGIILSLLIWDQQTISSSISSLILGSLLYLGRGMVCWEEKEGS